MKRMIAVICAVMMLAAAVFAGPVMAAEEDLTGTWNIQGMNQGGLEVDASFLSVMGIKYVLTLNEDGSCTMDMGDTVSEGTWSMDGTEGTITIDGDEAVLKLEEDGTLSVISEGQTLFFGHDEAQGLNAELAPALEDPKPEDFEGDWDATIYVAFGIPLPLTQLGAEIHLIIQDGKAAVSEIVKNPEKDGEITDSMDIEFNTEFQEDKTLYVDFNGENILAKIGMEADGIILTLHEDGRMSGTIPGMDDAMNQLGSLFQTGDGNENSDDGGSSGGMSMDMYLILERAEAGTPEAE